MSGKFIRVKGIEKTTPMLRRHVAPQDPCSLSPNVDVRSASENFKDQRKIFVEPESIQSTNGGFLSGLGSVCQESNDELMRLVQPPLRGNITCCPHNIFRRITKGAQDDRTKLTPLWMSSNDLYRRPPHELIIASRRVGKSL